jgi:hypothetical protein
VDFTVELGALKALGADLEHCGQTLGQALETLGQAGGAGLGRNSLDEACQRVQDDWHHGLDVIRQCSEKLSGGVQDSAKTYAQMEEQTAAGFDKVTDQLGG